MTEAGKLICPVRSAALARPRDLAMRGNGLLWGWRDYDEAVGVLAEGLRRAGVRVGDRVAGLAANSPEQAALVFAALRCGAVLAPLDLRRGASHWRRCLAALEPKLLCVDADHLAFARRSGLDFTRFDRIRATASCGEVTLDRAREASVVFTSGSGGEPKGVVLTLGNHLAAAAAASANLPLTRDDVWLDELPLYHVGGLAILLRCALAGAAVYVRDGFVAAETLDEIEVDAVTILSCVPQMLESLLAADPRARILSRARAILLGGGGADPGLLERCRRLAVPVLPSYGMTEAASQICTATPGAPDAGVRPLPGMSVRVLDGDGREAPPGADGEIAIRGPAVFVRYLDETVGEARDAEGWFLTGDLGRLEADGRLVLLGRRDAAFVSGGESIHPAEIESVARRYADLDDCAVIAAPSRRWGRRPILYVTPASLDPAALRAWLSSRLSRLLMPDEIVTVEDLPRLALGKIDRRTLLASHLGSRAGSEDPDDQSESS